MAAEVSKSLGLANVDVIHSRVEDEKRKFHYIVSRAVMPLPELIRLTRKNISKEHINALPNGGAFSLKGGDLTAELHPFKRIAEVVSLLTYFQHAF